MIVIIINFTGKPFGKKCKGIFVNCLSVDLTIEKETHCMAPLAYIFKYLMVKLHEYCMSQSEVIK